MCQRIWASALIAMVAAFATPAFAAYNLPGAWNGWDPTGNLMTDNLDGTYTLALTGLTASTRYEFKVVQDGAWANPNYPGTGNSWAYTDGAGNITVTFDTNAAGDGWVTDTNRIIVNTDPGAWTAVGDWQGWSNNNGATAMTDQGGGIYKLSYVIPTAGSYMWKAVNTGGWDAIGNDNRSINADNAGFTTTDPNQTVDFYVNVLNGSIQSVVQPVPEPAALGLMALGGLMFLRRRK